MKTNSIQLKKINVELVKEVLKEKEHTTRNQLSRETGLSLATCRNILNELIELGEVNEVEMGSSTGGRPSRRFSYNEKIAMVAALTISCKDSEKQICCEVYNLKGVVEHKQSKIFVKLTVEKIDHFIASFLEIFPQIKVISLGIPGVVHLGIIGICDIEALTNFPIATHLSNKFNRMVVVENDVNCAALGFFNKNKRKQTESLVYLFYPKNEKAGAGIIINGSVIKGSTDFAGEVAFLPLGISQSDQRQIQENSSLLTEFITKTILSINCLIDPANIIISGPLISKPIFDNLCSLVKKQSPPGHSPNLLHEKDIESSYLFGLKHRALEKLSCPLELIEKNIQ